ncbi:MAG: hypothetical protein Q9P01_05375 [Anaerolineae bacterium]|nr:hypothetical protein [Anaerolineae bacterium]
MNFLKKLFGGGGSSGDEFTLYVKPKMCNRIMPIVVKRKEQLSLNDSEDGYWVRKIANHPRCPFEVEVIIHFLTAVKISATKRLAMANLLMKPLISLFWKMTRKKARLKPNTRSNQYRPPINHKVCYDNPYIQNFS